MLGGMNGSLNLNNGTFRLVQGGGVCLLWPSSSCEEFVSTVTCPPVAMKPMLTPHSQLTSHTPSSRAPEFLAMKVKVEPTSRACTGCFPVLSSQGQTGLEVWWQVTAKVWTVKKMLHWKLVKNGKIGFIWATVIEERDQYIALTSTLNTAKTVGDL